MLPMNKRKQLKLISKGLYWLPLYVWNSYKPRYKKVSSETERNAEIAMRNAQRLIAYRLKVLSYALQN